MTGPGTRREPTDPGARARDVIEAPVRPVLGRRDGLRQQAGLIAVVTVAITVVAAGIGLFEGGSGDDRGPVASGPPGLSGPSRSASPVSSAATGLATPLPGLATSPATPLPGTTCLPVAPGALPELRLAASDGVVEPARGTRRWADRENPSPLTAAWPEVAPRLALVLDPSASLVLTIDAQACLRSVVAEYVAAGDRGDSPPPTTLLEILDGPPRATQDLGALPAGDWLVRVVASYATGMPGDDDQAVTEWFFRVFAGAGPGASPLVGPAVPCAPLPVGAPPPRLELVADDGEPVLGVDLAVYPGTDMPREAVVRGSFPGRLQLRVVGNACATSWQVLFMDKATRDVRTENVQDNPGQNPFLVAQNRIDLPNVIVGESLVEAIVDFGREISARAGWDVTIAGAPPPTVEAYGPGGAHVTARPACGVDWTLADGRSAWENCDSPTVPDGMELLRVRSGQAVRLEVADWTMVSWWIACGELTPDGARFLEDMGCNLGGGGDGVNDARPAMFLPFPGRNVVAAWMTSKRDGDIVGARYFLQIDAVP